MTLGQLGLLLMVVSGATLAVLGVSAATRIPVRCLLGRHNWEYAQFLGSETRYCPGCKRFEERGIDYDCRPLTPWKALKKW